jgi:hypothetical protein
MAPRAQATEELHNALALHLEREMGAKLKARTAYRLSRMKRAEAAPRLLQHAVKHWVDCQLAAEGPKQYKVYNKHQR